MSRKIIQYTVFAIAMLIIIVIGYRYWLHQKIYPNTDDAYIEANTINIAAQVTGKIQQVLVKNQQHVTQHQLLFTIDPAPFTLAVQQATATLNNTKQEIQAEQSDVKAAAAALAQSQAQLTDTEKNYHRIMTLVKKGFYAKSGGDNVTRQLLIAKQSVIAATNRLQAAKEKLGKTGDHNAQIEAATAALSQAELNLHHTKVYAPAAGKLAQLTLQPGQTITAYQNLFSLVENNHWWATAHFKETNLRRIRVGQKATIKVDMYPSHLFHGVVSSIGAGSGSSFSLFPSENTTGNWVKVTQRFPVRIDITDPDPHFPLRIGASCTVTVNTRHE